MLLTTIFALIFLGLEAADIALRSTCANLIFQREI
jgi:hypothetical protein